MALPARGRTLLKPPAGPADAPAALLGLCLAGPTASGKSALALALAQSLAGRLPIEIISVDSALVYRGMDIGTAKPSAAERAAVPHHLIDIIDPTESYSAARFVADAQQLAADIRARGALPLLVGGTMLYFKALRDGISAMPSANAEIRAQIDAEAAAQGWPALHAQLALVDATTAARLAPRDAQRIQRALEVWRSSGRSLSDWHAQDPNNAAQTNMQAHTDQTVRTADLQWPLLSLEPASRPWLHARIQQRLQQMRQAGLEHEVKLLRARGDLTATMPAMRCVGYRQIWQALDSAAGSAAPDWFEPAVAATRQLAKRQLTWLRSISSRTALPCEAPDTPREACNWLQKHVAQRLEMQR